MRVADNMLFETSQTALLKSIIQGAFFRSVGSLIMWLFALFAFWADEIQVSHFIGISCSVLFLVLISPPTLFIVKRIARKNVFGNFSLFICILEAIGYTGVIYSLGGIEATYLTPIYAIFIAFWGVTAPQKMPFIIAGLCTFAFGSMAALEALGIIPSLKVDPHFNPSPVAQFIRVSVVIGLLFIIAYISSFTAGKLKQVQDMLHQQNKELKDKTIQLENSRHDLNKANNGLEKTVTKLHKEIAERKKAEEEREKLIGELKKALKEIKRLRGILPLCSFCKKIRDDKGYWEQVDVYIHKHLQAGISHGVCPDCLKKHYPDLNKEP